MTDVPAAGAAGADLAAELLRLLRARRWSLSAAESLTGGLLCSALVAIPGASETVRGAVVAYDTSVKHTVLGVDAALLAEQGPVHPEVAGQMARGARRALSVAGRQADVGISTTGIAGPDSPDGTPVGTVHIGVVTPAGERIVSEVLQGDRARIRALAVDRALAAAIELVTSGGDGSVSAA